MKNTLIYILMAVALSSAQVLLPTDSTATITVASGQDSLPVLLDGQPIGKTPIKDFAVKSGSHELTVYSPVWPSWNQKDYKVMFVALPGQSYRFEPTFETLVTIHSIPYGASVYHRGKLLGTTPCQVNLREGLTADIELEGYVPVQVELTKQTHTVELEPLEDWVNARLEREQQRQQRIIRNRKLMFASLWLAAAAGYSTAYFRSKGNEEYDRYMRTAIPEKMDDYFRKAESYDRISSVSYALFEMGFVFAGYFFLTSRRD